LAALAQKDYEAVVSGLGKIQPDASDETLRPPYLILKRHVVDTLQEAALTDPKATEALNALRLLTLGR
jgi:hypothetical protein